MKTTQDLSMFRVGGAEKGSSLIEVLVALFIMMVLMLGILQMFSVAYMENMGVAARTEMTYKAQQFVENLRYLQALAAPAPTGLGFVVPNTGLALPIQASAGQIDPAAATYWNSANAGVVDVNSPYTLSYSITAGISPDGQSMWWNVTVFVDPKTAGPGGRYIGMGIKEKHIIYAASIRNPASPT